MTITKPNAPFSLAKPMATLAMAAQLLTVNMDTLHFRTRPFGHSPISPIITQDGKPALETMTRLAEAVGLTLEELSAAQTDKIMKVFDTYSDFFENYPLFAEAAEIECRFPNVSQLLQRYGESDFVEENALIAYGTIQKNLLDTLKVADPELVGRKNGADFIEIGYLESQNFCSFKQLESMVECYLTMVERVCELFDKTLTTSLTDSEISEYNILVTAVGAKDPAYRTINLYHSVVQKLKTLYLEEGFSSKQLHFREDFEPFKAIQFCMNESLSERYMMEIPQAKKRLGEYANLVANIRCYYRWVPEAQTELLETPTFDNAPCEYDHPEYICYDLPKTTQKRLEQDFFIRLLSDLSLKFPFEELPVTDPLAAKARYDALVAHI